MDKQPELEALAQTFLLSMGLSLNLSVTERDDSVLLELDGEDAYLLTERQGVVLEAMQLLLGKVAENRLGLQKRIVIECDGFRRDREEELAELARNVAGQVRSTQQTQEIGPFNSYERRLIHLAIQEEGDLETESLGEGSLKSILIRLK